jgi:pyruvate dehydrogenase E2 component (dihydrolipoamide acetyltransferase)
MSTAIVMPKAGLTMVEGTIAQWKVPEGAFVKKGDVLMEYENEKNTIDCEALGEGYVHILAGEGETVPVGEVIGMLAESREELAALTGGAPAAAPAEETEKGCARECPDCVHTAAGAPSPAPASRTPVMADGHVRASGLAKKLAKEAGVRLADIAASGGPDGTRIIARDVRNYLEQAKAKPAETGSAGVADEITEMPWTGVRKTIARNMYNSLQTMAQCTASCEVDVTDLLILRQKLVEQQEYLGCKITVNDLLCKAVAKLLVNHPLVNATFDGETLYSHKHVQLSVAVATENGLMVPVVKHADTLSLVELSRAIKDLGVRAKEKKLRAEEQGCGTFTVSNVGMFPIDFSTPIVNPPEVAIMGFGRTTKKPLFVDGQFVPRDTMTAYLTFDHRVVDGLEVGKIFRELQTLLEHPELILA